MRQLILSSIRPSFRSFALLAEWQVTDMATQAFSLVSMALYDTLGPDSAKYVCNHSQLAVIFCSIAHLPGMLGLLPDCSSVKAVVCMDALVEGSGERELALRWGKQAGVWVGDWNESESEVSPLSSPRRKGRADECTSRSHSVRKMGRENPSPPILPRIDTIATLSCNTSFLPFSMTWNLEADLLPTSF
jgi:long-chain acyl-CoA synthetase